MRKPSMLANQMQSKSKYAYLFQDDNFRRWFENLRRGSESTAHDWWYRLGHIHAKFGASPAQLAQMKPKEAYNFILDMVSSMENDGKSFSHIDSHIKALKNWLAFNDIEVTQKIRLSNQGVLVNVGNERTPTQQELRQILDMSNFRARVMGAFMAFSGVRPEVLGSFLGDDGLKVSDLPEMEVINDNHEVRFHRIPTMLVVRPSLSKAGHQYFTLHPEEGCVYLKEYLEWRMRRWEYLRPESPVITAKQIVIGDHMRTTNVGEKIRTPIRSAGFKWRPYVLRRYFDTRMMVAEMEGMIIRDFRVFWMGHKGDVEHTYTVNKRLPDDVIEKMRKAFERAANAHLQTMSATQSTERMVISTFNLQILKTFGYTEEEIAKIPDAGELSPERIQELIRAKSLKMLGLNCNTQKVVSMHAVEEMIVQGWEFVKELPDNKAVIRLPK